MKNYITILIVLFSLSVNGQSYKIKKGVLLKDKIPVANVEGKVGIKADLTIKNLDNTPILIVKDGHCAAELPGVKRVSWYTYNFPQIGKEMIIKQKSAFFGTKQFLKYEFQDKGIHFYADGLHESELGQLEDYGEQLHLDTMKIINSINFYKENLAASSIARNTNEPIKFGTFKNSSDIAILQSIDENETPIVIGKIEYYYNEGISISDPSRGHTIKIYKKLAQSVEFNGEQTSFLIAGYFDLSETIPRIFLYEDGEETSHLKYKIDKGIGGIKSAEDAAIFMASNGYL